MRRAMMALLGLGALALVVGVGCRDDEVEYEAPGTRVGQAYDEPATPATGNPGSVGVQTPRSPASADSPASAGSPGERVGQDRPITDRPGMDRPGTTGSYGKTGAGETRTPEMMIQAMASEMKDLGVPTATAEIQARQGASQGASQGAGQLQGQAMLGQVDEGVRVLVAVKGAPKGEHPVMIHQGGCSNAASSPPLSRPGSAATAGGGEDAKQGRMGNLGKLEVDDEGVGYLEYVVQNADLRPSGPNTFVGNAIVIHSASQAGGEDQEKSASAGAVLACGEIQRGAGQGSPGSPGSTGSQGSPGSTGSQGSPGSTGSQGSERSPDSR